MIPSESNRLPESEHTETLDAGALCSILFFVSGGAALLYQTAFIRAFVELFGSTATAMGAVVGAFLLCLSLGSFAVARFADRIERPLRMYAVLEAIAAVTGFGASAVLSRLEPVATSLAKQTVAGDSSMPWRVAIAVAVMILPIGALGGTLPLLARFRRTHRRRGTAAGGLQVASTLGAVAGVLLGSLWIMPAVGIRATILAAAASNGVVAVLAWLLGRGRGSSTEPGEAEAEASVMTGVPAWPYLFASAVSGAVVVAMEVFLFRGLSQVTRGGIGSMGILLATFLALNAIGTLVGIVFSRSTDGSRAGILVGLFGTAAGVLWGLWILFQLSYAEPGSFWLQGAEAVSYSGRLVREGLCALACAGPVALFAGVAFPCICQLRPDSVAGFGRWVGLLGGCWTAGATLAGWVLPLVCLPALGLKGSLLLVAGLPLLAFVAMLSAEKGVVLRRRAWIPSVGVVAMLLVVLIPAGDASISVDRLEFYRAGLAPDAQLIDYGEDEIANVAVVQIPRGPRVLKVNNHFALGGGGAAKVEGMQALLPALLAGEPRKALVLGVGAGVTVGALRDYGVFDVDAVEIIPKVMEFLPHFAGVNGDLLNDRGVHLYEEDARTFVRAAEEASYDLIIGDLFFPWQTDAGYLYTEEHFQRIRRLLKRGGVFCQWLPGHQLRWEEIGILGRTFAEVFDGTTFWLATSDFPFPVLGLVGAKGRLPLDVLEIEKRVNNPLVSSLLRRHGVDDHRRFLGQYIGDDFFFKEHFQDRESLNTVDLPRIEFMANRGVESDGVLSLQNRSNLSRYHEDIVGRMSTVGFEPKERQKLQIDLDQQSKLVWKVFEARTLRLLAQANRGLGEAGRLNDPEALELQSFQLLALLLVQFPEEDWLFRELFEVLRVRVRLGQYSSVVQAILSLLENEELKPWEPRLRNLRGTAFLLAAFDPAHDGVFNRPLEFAAVDFQKAVEADPGLVEAEINLGTVQFLVGEDEQARSLLEDARSKIKAPGREGGHALPQPAEAIYWFLNGEPDEARRMLRASAPYPYLAGVWKRFGG